VEVSVVLHDDGLDISQVSIVSRVVEGRDNYTKRQFSVLMDIIPFFVVLLLFLRDVIDSIGVCISKGHSSECNACLEGCQACKGNLLWVVIVFIRLGLVKGIHLRRIAQRLIRSKNICIGNV
jgi:hypothetical protein